MPTARHHPQVRKDDTIMVIAGRERGKTGKILKVMPDRMRVVVERMNVVKRHAKARGQQPGGIIEKESPIHISNVMVMCEKCNRPVRVGHKILAEERKVRVCSRCGEVIGA